MDFLRNQMFHNGEQIAGQYRVLFFIKAGSYAESYRVKDAEGKLRFLKIFHPDRMHSSQLDADGSIYEIEVLNTISHPNVVKYIDSGRFDKEGKSYAYLVLDFVRGETLAEKVKRENHLSVATTSALMQGVLEGLHAMHQSGWVHNEITPQNVMVNLSGDDPAAVIIDFGFARRYPGGRMHYQPEELDPRYLPNESFDHEFGPATDIFSVGAAMFHLLFGCPPWDVDLSKYKAGDPAREADLIRERNNPPRIPSLSGGTSYHIGDDVYALLSKALQTDPAKRFADAGVFAKALAGDEELKLKPSESLFGGTGSSNEAPVEHKPAEGEGFARIAGMEDLKELVFNEVIRALNERELYEEYGLTIPNGMLLYGPPGCGKTFFAERCAEEAGFNFVSIRPSDVASTYIHGQQQKIGALFQEARKKAPTILFFDEIDALMPIRTEHLNHGYSESVNEFLSQLSDCSKQGVFVIGATNRPDKVDPAILRTGRIDKIIYVPPPDLEAREAMFRLYLEKRPVENLDYKELGRISENYMSSDIEFMCNQAARRALMERSKITMSLMRDSIREHKPSVSKEDLSKYENMANRTESSGRTPGGRSSIGFRPPNS